jgi:hypothetical protein
LICWEASISMAWAATEYSAWSAGGGEESAAVNRGCTRDPRGENPAVD